jgi:apoptosis inducing membrane protein (fragment)
MRSEKDNRRGNFKADINIGIENQRVGFTLNAGYDTKGQNIRGGIGIRVIY